MAQQSEIEANGRNGRLMRFGTGRASAVAAELVYLSGGSSKR